MLQAQTRCNLFTDARARIMLTDKSKCVTKFDVNLLKIPGLTNGGNLQEVKTSLNGSSSYANAETNYVAGKLLSHTDIKNLAGWKDTIPDLTNFGFDDFLNKFFDDAVETNICSVVKKEYERYGVWFGSWFGSYEFPGSPPPNDAPINTCKKYNVFTAEPPPPPLNPGPPPYVYTGTSSRGQGRKLLSAEYLLNELKCVRVAKCALGNANSEETNVTDCATFVSPCAWTGTHCVPGLTLVDRSFRKFGDDGSLYVLYEPRRQFTMYAVDSPNPDTSVTSNGYDNSFQDSTGQNLNAYWFNIFKPTTCVTDSGRKLLGAADAAEVSQALGGPGWSYIQEAFVPNGGDIPGVPIPDPIDEAMKEVQNWVTDTIGAYVPSSWKVPTASPAQVEALLGEKEGKLNTFCQTSSGDIREACNALLADFDGRLPMEATVCDTNMDCESDGTTCFTPNREWCAEEEMTRDSGMEWSRSCTCSKLNPTEFHCNPSTRFCSAGKNPFLPPSEGACGTTPYFFGTKDGDRLCYAAEAWRCSDTTRNTFETDPSLLSRIDECLKELPPVGPYQCRTICDATFENEGNGFRTYKYANNKQTCVCQIGLGRLQMSSATPLEHSGNINPAHALHNGRRKMLQDASSNKTSTGFASFCSRTKDCKSTFLHAKICTSLWGTPVPCYSCSERNIPGLSFACAEQTKTCECIPKLNDDFNSSFIVDGTTWRGDSFCDRVLRGYHGKKFTTPLEKATIWRCTSLRAVGQLVLKYTGFQSVPPDIMYNPQRVLHIGNEIVNGLFLFYDNKTYSEKTVRGRVLYYDTLIDKDIDPIVIFKVNEYIERSLSVFSWQNAEYITQMAKNTTSEIVEKFLEHNETKHLKKSVETMQHLYESVEVYNKTVELSRIGGKMGFVAAQVTSKFIENLFTTYSESVQRAAEQDSQNSVSNVSSVSSVYHDGPSRRLLDDSASFLTDEEQCPLVSELYNVAMKTSSFVGDAVDGYVSYSVCRLKHYLNETHWKTARDKQKGFDGRRRLRAHDESEQEIDWLNVVKNLRFKTASDFFAKSFITLAQTRRLRVTWRQRTTDVHLWQCDIDKVLCQSNFGLGIRNTAEMNLLGTAAALFIGQFLKLQFLNILTLAAFLPFYGFVFVALSHDVSPACFPYVVPVCFVDDAIDQAEYFLAPKHIAWDRNIVQRRKSTGEIAGVIALHIVLNSSVHFACVLSDSFQSNHPVLVAAARLSSFTWPNAAP
jgi:hypothetical protein